MRTPICGGARLRVPATLVEDDHYDRAMRQADKLERLGRSLGTDYESELAAWRASTETAGDSGGRRSLATGRDRTRSGLTPPESFNTRCNDGVREVMVPVIEAMAEAQAAVTTRDQRTRDTSCANDVAHPLCRPAVDSTFGATPLRIASDGRIADRLGAASRRALAPRARSLRQAYLTTHLYVAPPVGGGDDRRGSAATSDDRPRGAGTRTEVFYEDEGICGIETHSANASAAIVAIAFRGCSAALGEFSPLYGLESRATELNREAESIRRGGPRTDNPFGRRDEDDTSLVRNEIATNPRLQGGGAGGGGATAADKFNGREGLTYTTRDDGVALSTGTLRRRAHRGCTRCR